jgi:hypothetical protein
MGFEPAGCADAPVVTRLEPGKVVGRGWGAQVVPLGLAVAEKSLGHHTANAVAAKVSGVGVAIAIAMPAGHRLASANQHRLPQHVETWVVGLGRGVHGLGDSALVLVLEGQLDLTQKATHPHKVAPDG